MHIVPTSTCYFHLPSWDTILSSFHTLTLRCVLVRLLHCIINICREVCTLSFFLPLPIFLRFLNKICFYFPPKKVFLNQEFKAILVYKAFHKNSFLFFSVVIFHTLSKNARKTDYWLYICDFSTEWLTILNRVLNKEKVHLYLSIITTY